MSTSKLNTETGWTKPLPLADGDYFSRVDGYDKSPTLIRIENHEVYEIGQGGNLAREYAAEDYEYLGPFTVADFEQLTRLREAAKTASEVLDLACAAMQAAAICCPGDLEIALRERAAQCDRTIKALDEALTQRATGEES